MQQLRHGQHQQISRPCCRGAPSFPGAAAAARPVLALGAAAARSAPPGKLLRRTSACLGQAAAASSGKPRASPARAVAGPATPAGVQVGGKLLLQTFDDAPNSPLRLSIQLVSATVAGSDGRGVKAEASVLDAVVVGSGDTELDVNLVWDEALGAPGAVVVKNLSDFPVYLKLLSAPAGLGADKQAAAAAVHFACNGWVYPVDKHPYRLFFTNDACVKEDTPSALLKYREDELSLLRGDGEPADRPFQPWDRVYDYALYNDLGNPDLRRDLARPVLGGSDEYPYPRRTKTGRPAAKTDPRSETRAALDEEIYVPCDERVGYGSVPAPTLPPPGGHFGSLADIYRLFGLDDLGRLPEAKAIINSSAPFPVAPRVISVNPTNWRKDEEFARQMIAGANPVCIKRVTRFPLTSELDRSVYGDQDSKITRDHVEKNMGGMTVQQAMEEGMLFVVDHHDWVMPYLKRINELPGEEEKAEISQRKVYAARTLLFLNREDSTLKPLAIELSSPHPENEQLGAVSKVYTPPENGDVAAAGRFSAWELAKAHAAANDTVENNFVTHWLNTHATMEPFVIAANRHLSVLHPIHRLLKPHFRKTLHINAVARQIVVGSGDLRKNGSIFRGIHEVTYFPSKYNIEMSSKAYEAWNFTELALPNDLIKRGLARGDPKNPEELELLIKDYPYAVDGLEMWAAIKKWVTDYCAIYYADDGAVARDRELQGWWSEARDVGHGDLRGAPWWPAMSSVADLVEACATVIWLGSAYHAAISFGQYDYQGFVPNGPSLTTGPVPDAAGAEVTEAEFLGSVTPVTEALGFMSIASGPLALTGEVYLGQRPDSEQWTKDRSAAMALAEFRARLKGVAESIERRNADPELKNRTGPVEVPYTLLKPTAQPGPVLRGIPNSITV